MKYVFFDIECACVYKSVAKICAFGYVVTDEAFRVLEREEILLNPKGKFHLTDRKGREGLVLPYVYEDFKKYPLFPAAYARIKALLEDRDHIVLGHATLNDVNYLNLETRRYKLPSLKFRYYDTQFFYMNVKKDFSRQLGLGAMAEELGVEFTPHRAVDDAYATMRVCEAILRQANADTVPAFAEHYRIRAGRSRGIRSRRSPRRGCRPILPSATRNAKSARKRTMNFTVTSTSTCTAAARAARWRARCSAFPRKWRKRSRCPYTLWRRSSLRAGSTPRIRRSAMYISRADRAACAIRTR